ncbi:MAG: VWA domain-containing protein [Calditrichaeota bacterium]|jgi:uncharacterized protein YegL|nr:VWA domain-containing protein [Calditrichota bacterium]
MKKIIFVILILNLTLTGRDCVSFKKIDPTNRFVLIVDVSGSMSGNPIQNAKAGLLKFVDAMGKNDQAALLMFNDKIITGQSLTSNKHDLKRAINKLSASGGTHLYDAIAAAMNFSKKMNKKTAFVLLSDGVDGGSKFNHTHIKSMVGYEGVAFYAIGLGKVDSKTLQTIANKTSGKFTHTNQSDELKDIYQNTLKLYQKVHGGTANTAQVLVHSMPGGRPILIDGKRVGFTPKKIYGIEPGEHKLTVQFENGPWNCESNYPSNFRGYIKAHASEVDKSIAITTTPHGSAVFLDGEYQGKSSSFALGKTTDRKKGLFKKKLKSKEFSKELVIENVPKGKHQLSVVPFPNSPVAEAFEPIAYSFVMADDNLHIHLNILKNEVDVDKIPGALKSEGVEEAPDLESLFDDF